MVQIDIDKCYILLKNKTIVFLYNVLLFVENVYVSQIIYFLNLDNSLK